MNRKHGSQTRYRQKVQCEGIMKFITDTHPSPREMQFLEKQLLHFNGSKVDGYAYENCLIKAVDGSDSIIAGIHGQMGGGWLYIASLWVDERHRGSGIGGRLLRLLEETAVKQGCHGAYLYTYSFQSPGFYKKFKYDVFGALEGFCDEHIKLFMKKKFG